MSNQKHLIVKPKHFHLRQIRNENKLCDLILKVGNEIFYAHKAILAATIPYFHYILNDSANKREIDVKGIDPSAMKIILQYTYGEEIQINDQNVKKLFVASSFLLLKDIRNACSEFLYETFNPESIISMRNFVHSMDHENLVSAANNYISKHLAKVSLSNEFLFLNLNELIEIIGNDHLNVDKEETVYEACMLWIRHDEVRRSKLIAKVLAHVRFSLISPKYLYDYVEKENLVKSCLECRDMLDKAKNFHLISVKTNDTNSVRTYPRRCANQIYIIGGEQSFNNWILSIEIYDPITKTWEFGEGFSVFNNHYNSIVFEDKLYVFGEYGDFVNIFDPKKLHWKHGELMLEMKNEFSCALLDDHIYICGGHVSGESGNISAVDRYNPISNTWKTVAPMLWPRRNFSVVAHCGYLYALGGSNYSLILKIERYDPATDSWKEMQSLKKKRTDFGAAVLNGQIYICGGVEGSGPTNSVEVYDIFHNMWKSGVSMQCKRARCAVVVYMDMLFAFGGYTGTSRTPCSSVEVYDPTKNNWSLIESMNMGRALSGAVILPRFNKKT